MKTDLRMPAAVIVMVLPWIAGCSGMRTGAADLLLPSSQRVDQQDVDQLNAGLANVQAQVDATLAKFGSVDAALAKVGDVQAALATFSKSVTNNTDVWLNRAVYGGLILLVLWYARHGAKSAIEVSVAKAKELALEHGYWAQKAKRHAMEAGGLSPPADPPAADITTSRPL